MDPAVFPEKVNAEVSILRSATGVEPVVTSLGRHKWRIEVFNDRVHMTVDFKITGAGHLHWLTSSLLVDGDQRPLAKDEHDLADIMRNPDRPAFLDSMPPEVSIDHAPGMVKHYYTLLRSKLGDEVVLLGCKEGVWVIGIGEGGHGIRVMFKSSSMKNNYYLRIQLVLDGVDRSAQVGDNLAEALALLSGNNTVTPASIPSASSTPASSAKRFDSAAQRKSSVFRI